MVFEKIKKLSLFGLILLLALLLLLGVRRFTVEPPVLHVSFTIGFLLLLGFAGGRIASVFSLPQLSGFLAVGVLCGTSGLSLIGPLDIEALAPFNQLALALIAIQAGSEISVKFLKSGGKSLLSVLLMQTSVLILGMTATFFVLVYGLHFKVAESNAAVAAGAIIFAVLSVSKAPADTLAILGETGLKGRFADHILGVVVLVDILVIALFQLTILVVKPYVIEGAFFDGGKAIGLLAELLSSVAAGFSVGLIFICWFLLFKHSVRQSILFVILAAFGTGSMCHYLKYDAMLVFIVGGFMVSNLSSKGHALVDTVEKASHGVMIVFFATAGAMLDLKVLTILWPYALILACSRIVFTAVGTWLGHWLAKDDLPRYRYSFAGYISQAGVTLVLAQNASIALGQLGQKIAALATAMVAINEIIGPVAFKLAIKRETNKFI